MEKEIKLGDTVKCLITGFEGIAVNKTEYINGCIQFGVAPKVGKDNTAPEAIEIDSQSLKIIKKGPNHKEPEEELTGGPNRKSIKQRGY